MKPILLLDVDGVLADFVSAFLAVVKQRLGRVHEPDDVASYGIANSLGLSKDEFDLCAEIVEKPGFCRSLDVYPGAIDGVRALSEIAEIYVVTSPWNSNPTWTHDREAWLDQHFAIAHHHVIHTSAKHLVRGDVFVDDKTSTVRDWRERNPDGVAVQWRTPHNRDDRWDGASTRDWSAIVQLVKQLEERAA